MSSLSTEEEEEEEVGAGAGATTSAANAEFVIITRIERRWRVHRRFRIDSTRLEYEGLSRNGAALIGMKRWKFWRGGNYQQT